MSRRYAIARQLVALLVIALLTVFHTWPLALVWKTELLGGELEDPWMNLWHADWVRRCLLAHRSPYFAEVLHAPLGAELYWHTLSPAKSVLGALLIPLVGHVGSLNLVVATTFVFTGMTMFWLCADRLRDLPPLRRDAAALVGACVFDFSRYHLAHAVAHVNLAALEGMPLFVLAFLRSIETGKRRWMALAGAAAGYVALCDFYYVYYLALVACVWLVARLWHDEARMFSSAFLARLDVRRAAWVALVSALCALPAVLPLLLHLHPEPIGYHHGDSEYPTDLLAPFVPDHLSMWNAYIPEPVRGAVNRMQREITNDAEGGVFLGVAAPLLAWLAVRRRAPDARRWLGVFVVFAVLSLGVYLSIGGFELHSPVLAIALVVAVAWPLVGPSARGRDLRVLLLLVLALSPFLHLTAYGRPVVVRFPLPYLPFKHLVPLFGRGGMPVRFLLLSQLALAVLAARGAALLSQDRWWPVLAVLVLVNLETKSVAYEAMHPASEAPLDPIRLDPEPYFAVYTDHVLGQWEETVHHRPVSFARQSRLPERERSMTSGPLYRQLVDPKHIADPVDAPMLASLQSEISRGHYKYFVAHAAAVRFGDYPHELDVARRRLLERLGASLLSDEPERQIYRLP